MKKYRHKTLDVIVKHKGVGEYDVDFSDIKNVPVSLSFDFNDGNWEEIIDRKYLITSFVYTIFNQIYKQDSQLKDEYCLEDGRKPFYSLAYCLKHNSLFKIRSVKRLIDGLEFQLGEKVKTAKDNFIIKEFKINGGETLVLFEETFEHDGLDLIQKYVAPTFTTTDGASLKEGDAIWFINDWHPNWRYLKFNTTHPETKYFSTKEAAEEWLKLNKPKYSLEDIKKCYPIPKNTPNYIMFINSIKELNK